MKKNIALVKSDASTFFALLGGVSDKYLTDSGEFRLNQGLVTFSQLAQASLNGMFIKQLKREFDELHKKGVIKKDILQDERFRTEFVKLLKLLDEKVVDEDVFGLLKAILIASVTTDRAQQEQVEAYFILDKAKNLTSIQYTILTACYKESISPEKKHHNGQLYADWLNAVLEHSWITLTELIDAEDDRLVDLKLLTPKVNTDNTYISKGSNIRLTRVSLKMFELLNEYEKL